MIQQIIDRLSNKILMMLASAVLEKIDDSQKIQKVQVSILDGEVHSDYDRFQEFGFSSVPLPGCQAFVACVSGSRDHGVVLATDDIRYRPIDLEPGESVIYNSEGYYAKLKVDGTFEIYAPEVNMSGNLTVQGNITCEQNIAAEGNITAEGNISAEGDITDKSASTGRSMASMRTIYNAHTHVETDSTTEAPASQM